MCGRPHAFHGQALPETKLCFWEVVKQKLQEEGECKPERAVERYNQPISMEKEKSIICGNKVMLALYK